MISLGKRIWGGSWSRSSADWVWSVSGSGIFRSTAPSAQTSARNVWCTHSIPKASRYLISPMARNRCLRFPKRRLCHLSRRGSQDGRDPPPHAFRPIYIQPLERRGNHVSISASRQLVFAADLERFLPGLGWNRRSFSHRPQRRCGPMGAVAVCGDWLRIAQFRRHLAGPISAQSPRVGARQYGDGEGNSDRRR